MAKLHFLDTLGFDSLKGTVYRSTNGHCRYLFGHILAKWLWENKESPKLAMDTKKWYFTHLTWNE